MVQAHFMIFLDLHFMFALPFLMLHAVGRSQSVRLAALVTICSLSGQGWENPQDENSSNHYSCLSDPLQTRVRFLK